MPIKHKMSMKRDRNEMAQVFNRQHGARNREFQTHQLVWVRASYQTPNRPVWVSGRVLGKQGRTLYDVIADNQEQKRHSNQLRRRENIEAWSTLLIAFDLPLQSTDEPSCPKSPPDGTTTTPATGRSTRNRKLTMRMQIDPSKNKYDDY